MTIYKWIWTAKHSNHRDHAAYKRLYKDPKHNGRRQKRSNVKDNRGVITGRTGIEHHPEVVNELSRIGDIEVDPMMGSNHKPALLVMKDRTTLAKMIEKLDNKNAGEVYGKMKNRSTAFNSSWIRTITFDNGKGFAQHHKPARI